MPKLSNNLAQQAAEASSSFDPLPEGVYNCVLAEVTSHDGPKGISWKWEFKVKDEEYKDRKLFTYTSLNDNALWKLKEVFEGFGASTDTDTDDLVGCPVKVLVSQRVIESGSRKGDMGNQVDKVLPSENADAKPVKGKTKSKDAAEDLPLF